jgi:hypothetical protein
VAGSRHGRYRLVAADRNRNLSGRPELEHALQKRLHILDGLGVRASIIPGGPTTLETLVVSRERHTGLAIENTPDRLFE